MGNLTGESTGLIPAVLATGTGGADGVFGASDTGNGIAGLSDSGTGVSGRSSSGVGVSGSSGMGHGVSGYSTEGAGVFGSSDTGPAGSFQGNVSVSGDITVGGDVKLTGADCAEMFDVNMPEPAEPGSVMVIGDDGRLRTSQKAYDRAVAGVVSGAAAFRPGIVLDRHADNAGRAKIALVGKVYCKVDADSGPISVGDLLTSSNIPGFAMKAVDPIQGFGAVIGKALRPMADGRGLLPILVALQ